MSRQASLFLGAGFSEEDLENLVSPLHPQLFGMISEPFSELLDYRRTDPNFRIMDEGETAQWLRPQIVDRARRMLGGLEGVRIRKFNNQFQIIYRDSVVIVPKKLKLGGRNRTRITFSSYETIQNKSYWQQQVVAGLEDLPRVLVGYLPQKEMTEIKIMVVYPRGKFARFCYLMPDQSSAQPSIYEAREDVSAEEAESRGFVVKPKTAKRKPR